MKRTATEAQLADPGPFLRNYFERHDMGGDADCSLSRELVERAELAREEFKRIRTGNYSEDEGVTTGEQKYNRRLANNRNSAAASRVFREVLKKEQEYGLMRASVRAEELDLQLASLQEENMVLTRRLERLVAGETSSGEDEDEEESQQQKENIKLKAEIAKLQAMLEKQGHNRADTQVSLQISSETPNASDPGSPIDEESTPSLNELPPLRLGYMFPALFCASQNDKDVVRYGDVLPRSTVTPRESLSESQEEGPMKRGETCAAFNESVGETPQDLRISMNAPLPSGLLESNGSLHLGITQESQGRSVCLR